MKIGTVIKYRMRHG